ncbi:MAG: hypothetical protein KKG09_00480 [Verrucomicrobia bacterium]|nr:hypothetical protein [Verrucomicrobiota bacterium]MBU4430281.1 hypothetical protein [Verrucomicrobiota bacterium]MBU4496467.1 hypothetical protein [Verrucomicrobiota bacterium]MCG2679679.1 hypothetical protein [Kiritimatiellia bacterium]
MSKKHWIIFGIALIGLVVSCFGQEPTPPGEKQPGQFPLVKMDKAQALNKLAQIKVVAQYRSVTDGKNINRTLEEVIGMLKETSTDFIFLGWMTQQPCPEKISDLPVEKQKMAERHGYSYEHLAQAISQIKNALPGAIFCGGVQAEFLWPDEVPGKDEKERVDKAWAMALDPGKWGIAFSKKDMQGWWAKRWGAMGKGEELSAEEELKLKMLHSGLYHCFFPDLTNPDFQAIFLNRIYEQIDAGAEAIWIDMLYAQGHLLKKVCGINESHTAVQESHRAASEIVDRIHAYGARQGKYIYVTTWVVYPDYVGGDRSSLVILHPSPNVDIAMTSPGSHEILNIRSGKIGQFHNERWDKTIEMLHKLGIRHIFARIDFGGIGRSPLRAFSQELNSEQQQQFLKAADEFFAGKGIQFIYPIRGGDMGPGWEVKKLAFGKFNWYDSLAPEFATYEAIKKLAQKKAEGGKP